MYVLAQRYRIYFNRSENKLHPLVTLQNKIWRHTICKILEAYRLFFLPIDQS